MKALALLLLALPFSAGAVQVKNCPQTFTLHTSSIRMLTETEFKATDEYYEGDWEDEEIQWVYQNLSKADATDFEYLNLTLVSTANSMCDYLPMATIPSRSGDSRTRLKKMNGKDMLRVSYKIDDDYYWIWLPVKSVSREGGIETYPSKGSKMYGWFDHGAPRKHMAWANGITTGK